MIQKVVWTLPWSATQTTGPIQAWLSINFIQMVKIVSNIAITYSEVNRILVAIVNHTKIILKSGIHGVAKPFIPFRGGA